MKPLRVLCVILSCVMAILLPGCSSLNPILSEHLKELNSKFPSEEKSKLETTKAVLNCFSKKDAKSLKILLCPKTQGLTDIDEQIHESFDLFKGKVISFNEHLLGSEESDTEKGKEMLLERAWNVESIKTDAGKVYEIYIKTYIINENEKKKEGISQITITNSAGKELKIGYTWPSYYREGSDMSYKVIKAFSENDMDGLKTMLCSKTLEIKDINSQIQEGFNFFEGKATMGKVKGSSTLYDGKHDYHTSVSEDEIVKNNKPTRTFITVHNDNIETDVGKIYKIEFYAYLLYDGNEANKGISQIIVISDDGKKQVIGKKVD